MHRAAILAAAALALSACSSAGPGGVGGDPPGPSGGSGNNANETDAGSGTHNTPMVQLQVMPTATHSGWDGMHTYRVPVAVYGASDAMLVASDASMVSIEAAQLTDTSQDQGKYFMVTAHKAGAVTLTAKTKGGSASATLNIATYALDDFTVGAQRYMNAAASGPACIQCHSANGGIDHSPSQMASASDSDVVSVITTGVLVEGNPITQVKHKWAVSEQEARGLVAYLRALPPRGFVGVQ
jgi:mono/diheme cytochrome c family protein